MQYLTPSPLNKAATTAEDVAAIYKDFCEGRTICFPSNVGDLYLVPPSLIEGHTYASSGGTKNWCFKVEFFQSTPSVDRPKLTAYVQLPHYLAKQVEPYTSNPLKMFVGEFRPIQFAILATIQAFFIKVEIEDIKPHWYYTVT